MFELIPFVNNRHMVNYDPFEEMERSFFGSGAMAQGFRTDVTDNGNSFVLEAELPGFKKEDISLDVKNDCLTIKAERKLTEEDRKKNYIKRERVYGSFSRSFDVSMVEVDKIDAGFENGILTITMPKKAEAIPASRKLEIK